MIDELTLVVVIVFGIAICTGSLLGLVQPEKLMHVVYTTANKGWGIQLAVALRLALGFALIIAAPASRFPLIFEILGWIVIIAAIGIILMGRARLSRFVGWFRQMTPAMIRTWLIFGVAFGVLLVYGAMP